MIQIPVRYIVETVQEELIEMASNTQTRQRVEIMHDEKGTTRTRIDLELTLSPSKEKYFDATIMVYDFFCEIGDKICRIEFSIFSRRCITGNDLNGDAPRMETILQAIVNTDGGNIPDFQQMGLFERELGEEVFREWFSDTV
jgi:hypothetical protein